MNVCMENNYFKMAVGALNRKHFNLCINNVFFKDLDKEWSRDEFIFRLMRVYFHILHEKEHIKQFTKVFNGEMNHEIERWKKEMVLTFNSDFYNKYGINFEIEKKANEYALNNVLRYYRMVMGRNLNVEKYFINKYEPKPNDYIPNKEFEKILKDAYEKFVYENPMYLKKVNSYIDKDTDNKVIKK